MEPPTRSTAVPTMTYCTAPETGRRPTRCGGGGFDICYVDKYDQ
jgi:hypothetical protein